MDHYAVALPRPDGKAAKPVSDADVEQMLDDRAITIMSEHKAAFQSIADALFAALSTHPAHWAGVVDTSPAMLTALRQSRGMSGTQWVNDKDAFNVLGDEKLKVSEHLHCASDFRMCRTCSSATCANATRYRLGSTR